VAGLPPEWADVAITGVVINSRAVRAGSLFVALRGAKTDGHLYLSEAFARGAVAAIAEPSGIAEGRLQLADCQIVDCKEPRVEIPQHLHLRCASAQVQV